MPEPKVETLDVTPEMAHQLLEQNHSNRNLNRNRVARYANSIRIGAFPFIGDPVRLSEDGFLLDGQHRLHAILAAGVPLKMLIISNLPAETQRYMDSGRPRTAADAIHMLGLKNPTICGGAARIVLTTTTEPEGDVSTWDRRVALGLLVSRTVVITNPEVVDWVDEHRNIETSAEIGTAAARGVTAQPSALTAFHYLARRIDPYVADEFLVKLGTGAELEVGNPIHTVRETINRQRREGLQVGSAENLHYLIAAWNHYRKGAEIGRVQLPKGGMSSSVVVEMR